MIVMLKSFNPDLFFEFAALGEPELCFPALHHNRDNALPAFCKEQRIAERRAAKLTGELRPCGYVDYEWMTLIHVLPSIDFLMSFRDVTPTTPMSQRYLVL